MEPRLGGTGQCARFGRHILLDFPGHTPVRSRSQQLAVPIRRSEPTAQSSKTSACAMSFLLWRTTSLGKNVMAVSAGTADDLAGAVLAVVAFTDRTRVRSVGTAKSITPIHSAGAWPLAWATTQREEVIRIVTTQAPAQDTGDLFSAGSQPTLSSVLSRLASRK